MRSGVGGNSGARNSSFPAPLLKWPGGKRGLLPHLLHLAPNDYNRYYEPFLGGGALFFAMRAFPATLSDTNEELINCYRAIRDDPEAVIEHLKKLKNSKAAYLRVRASAPRTAVSQAARTIYLSTLAFNGIYRVNRRGQFNVPYGRKRHLDVVQRERIMAISDALRGRSIRCQDFQDAVRDARCGDLVYLDPPYTIAHGDNGFLRYNAKIFSWEDQIRLAETALDLARRGCHVLITNASHPSIRKLHKGLTQIEVVRPSRVAASAEYRRAVSELIITNLG